jgi:hypothetical protein
MLTILKEEEVKLLIVYIKRKEVFFIKKANKLLKLSKKVYVINIKEKEPLYKLIYNLFKMKLIVLKEYLKEVK